VALTAAQIQRYFKIFGKIIKLQQTAQVNGDGYRRLMATSTDQSVSGNANEFATISNVLNPMTTAMSQHIKATDSVFKNCVKYCNLMLQQVIAADAGMPAGSTVAAVGAQLIADMTANSLGVAAFDTTTPTNTTGIGYFFATQLGIILPIDSTNTPASIPDTYIDADVVP
jgi:hypothetical protein